MRTYLQNDLSLNVARRAVEKWNSLSNGAKWECVRDYTCNLFHLKDNSEEYKLERAEYLFNNDVNFWFFILGGFDAADLPHRDPQPRLKKEYLKSAETEESKQPEIVKQEVSEPENKKVYPDKDYTKQELTTMFRELEKKYNPYPISASFRDVFFAALNDNVISERTYHMAYETFKRIWDMGD